MRKIHVAFSGACKFSRLGSAIVLRKWKKLLHNVVETFLQAALLPMITYFFFQFQVVYHKFLNNNQPLIRTLTK